MDNKSVKNLSAVVDFLNKNDDPEYKTTKEIFDGVYSVVSNGLKIADIFTGGFYSGIIDKIKPDKLIDKLPDDYKHMNASREKIAQYYFDKNILANFMIVWVTIDQYMVEKELDIITKEKDDYYSLLKFPEFSNSDAYIKQIMIALNFDISDEEIENIQKKYHIYIEDIKKDVKSFENFVNGEREKNIANALSSLKDGQEEILKEVKKISIYETPKILTPTLGSEQARNFVGREDELKELEEQLSQNSSLLLINGIGGIGKSALASQYLSIHKDTFDHCGYISVFNDIKSTMVSALRSSLKLQAQTIEEDFSDAITKLQNLEGKKLLVIDDIKEVEKQSNVIKIVQGLSGWELLFTSRELIEDVTAYELDRLSLEDARELFISHFETKDIEKIDGVLKYLDRHTLFVELTAKSLKKDKKLTLDGLLEMFQNGALPEVRTSRKESFNDYLNQRFSLDGLDESQKLLLKKLSLMPSVKISYKTLDSFFKMEDLGWILDELRDKGWLSGDDNRSYKMHQIIKEFVLNTHTPIYEEIEDIVDYLNRQLKNSANPQTAVDNKENILYFESITDVLLQKNIENENVALFLLNVGNVFYDLGAYEKALPLYEKALKIREEVLGENHPSTATSYNNLAGLYESMGAYEKALPLYKKALKISKSVLGDNHRNTAASYNNLAVLYQSIGAYEKALPLFEKFLKIREEVLGENHPDTAGSYNNLAELYRSMGAYEKALPLYEKALKISEEVLVENHPDTATSYNNLAVFYFGLQNYQEAYIYMKKAVAVCQQVLPASHPDLLDSQKGLKLIQEKLK